MAGKAADIFKSYSRRLLIYIKSRINLPDDAEDIMQEVFYQFARQFAGINDAANPVENASAWLYHAARNKIIDHYKKKKDAQLPASYDAEEGEYVIDEIADILFGEEAGPEAEYLRSLIFEEIKSALDDLPKEQREVFELSEIFDVPVKEIAKRTGVPVNTVLSRKHYAVRFLRKRLQELYCDVIGASSNGK